MTKPVCPHCQVALKRRTTKGIFQYYCPSCLGFAVHFGGLANLMDARAVKLIRNSSNEALDGKVPCSHCTKLMKVVYSGEAAIELDICRRCNLLWLDTGEWDDIQKQDPPRSAPDHESVLRGRVLLKLEEAKRASNQILGFEPIDLARLQVWEMAAATMGLPVQERRPHFSELPWITLFLIPICILTSILGFRNMDWVAANLSYQSDSLFSFDLLTMFTSFFVHSDWINLGSNMYFLWVFGVNVEEHISKGTYAHLLVWSTISGELVFSWLRPDIPLIGTSGAISGLIAFYLLRFPHRRFFLRFYFGAFAVPGWVLGCLFYFKDIIAVFAEIGDRSPVASFSQLGGAVVGVAFALFYKPSPGFRMLDDFFPAER